MVSLAQSIIIQYTTQASKVSLMNLNREYAGIKANLLPSAILGDKHFPAPLSRPHTRWHTSRDKHFKS